MQRKSWGEERKTFILALGHLAYPLNFYIVSMENAFLYHKPQKDHW